MRPDQPILSGMSGREVCQNTCWSECENSCGGTRALPFWKLARVTGSKREAVLLCYLIGGIFGMISIFITTATVLEGYLVGLAVASIVAYLLWWLEVKVGYE